MSWMDLVRNLLGRPRRRGWRKDVRLPVQILLPSGAPRPAEITEASPTGFRLRTTEKHPTGRVLTMVLQGTPPRGENLEVPVEIRWNRQVHSVGGFRFRAGGQFCVMSDELRRKVAERLLNSPGLEMVDGSEKRRHVRVLQNARVGNQDMVVRDISATGVGLLSRTPHQVGEVLELVLNLDGPVPCRGTVVRSVRSSDPRVFELGLEFVDLGPRLQADLVASIDAMIDQARNPEANPD